MSTLLSMLTQQLGGDTVKKISSQLGADENKTKGAISASLPLLINALSRNASSDEGANALSNALSKDHDSGDLGNLQGFLYGLFPVNFNDNIGKTRLETGNNFIDYDLGIFFAGIIAGNQNKISIAGSNCTHSRSFALVA